MESYTHIIKIGGAAITDKTTRCTLNTNALNTFVQQLMEYIFQQNMSSTTPPLRFLIVHGAGSFGHFTAKEYRMGSEPPHPDLMSVGLPLLRSELAELHSYVMSALERECRKRRGDDDCVEMVLRSIDVSDCAFSYELNDYVVPESHAMRMVLMSSPTTTTNTRVQCRIDVSHGTVVSDQRTCVRVLSADDIVRLAQMLHPTLRSVVFITDVDGVYDKDPKGTTKALRIPFIRVQDLNSLSVTSTDCVDVTGGM
eukprot:PhF_6_TR19843/c0_g1_i2/m.28930/K06981/ipk; isopentenyl phosphate kinase